MLIGIACLADLITFLWLGQRNGHELNGPMLLLYAHAGPAGLVAAKIVQASLLVALADGARRSRIPDLQGLVIVVSVAILAFGIAGNAAAMTGFSITF